MSTTPPEQSQSEPGGSGPGYSLPSGARLPIPGNAEAFVYVLAVIVVAIIWAASDAIDAGGFVTALVVLTFGYMLSRGIAKASRVLEH